jgi:hypothetical protein
MSSPTPTENVESMIEKEAQLRLQITNLEVEAAAKKQAAEKAIQEAMHALNEVNNINNSISQQQQEQSKDNTSKSINGTIDAIAQMIKIAEKEAATNNVAPGEGREVTGSPYEHIIDKELAAAAAAAVSSTNTNFNTTSAAAAAAAEEGRPEIESPPLIVRQTDFLPSTTTNDNNNNNDDSDPKPDPESNDLRVVTSNLSMESTIGYGYGYDYQQYNTNKNTDRSDTMEGTLDTLMSKIEDCTAILTDPESTMEEQVEAAHLARQYAKAAKALHNAM